MIHRYNLVIRLVRHIAVLTLGILFLALIACGDTKPLPETIEVVLKQSNASSISETPASTPETTTGMATDFELVDSSGTMTSLYKMLSTNRFVILVFYRGHF